MTDDAKVVPHPSTRHAHEPPGRVHEIRKQMDNSPQPHHEIKQSTDSKQGVPGTGVHHAEMSNSPGSSYDGTHVGFVQPGGYTHSNGDNYSNARSYRNTGDNYSDARSYRNTGDNYSNTRPSSHYGSEEGGQHDTGIGQILQSGNIQDIVREVTSNPESLQHVIHKITHFLGDNKMGNELGTAALAALVGKNDSGGFGGIGGGVLGGALGAILLEALRGGGFGGGRNGGVLTELEIQNAVSAIKGSVEGVKSTIEGTLEAQAQAQAVEKIDSKIDGVRTEVASKVGHLSEQLEGVKAFLVEQQKNAEIAALNRKVIELEVAANDQKLVNMFREAKEHINVTVKSSHDGIHDTIRAILPLLVPAAAGGGSSIPTSEVLAIAQALSAFGGAGSRTSESVSIRN